MIPTHRIWLLLNDGWVSYRPFFQMGVSCPASPLPLPFGCVACLNLTVVYWMCI